MPDFQASHPEAEENRRLYDTWSNARVDWESDARMDMDFYLGNQYSAQESNDLRSMGQGDFTIDRIYPAIEKLKALITSRPPKFDAVGREVSDNKLAKVWKIILEYVWDISDGSSQFKQVVHDYAVCGKGYMLVHVDKERDWGRGDVKVKRLDPFRVYVDPQSKERFEEDASAKIVSTIVTKKQAESLYPKINWDEVERISDDEDFPDSQQKNIISSYTPADIDYQDVDQQDKYQILEKFEKVKVSYWRVKALVSNIGMLQLKPGEEIILNKETYEQARDKLDELVRRNIADVAEIRQTRVKLTATVGQIKLYDAILNTEFYPIIPFPNIWTGTPFPKSDVSKVKDSQRLLNKVFSLTLAHAQSSAGARLLLPSGAVDSVEDFQRDFANPQAVMEYDPNYGEPHQIQVSPLSAEFYNIVDRVEHYIDLSLGIPELMHGFAEGAPDTVRGTKILKSMGEGRGQSKLRDLESSLIKVGQVVYNFVRGHYTYEKTFRIVQPKKGQLEAFLGYADKSEEALAVSDLNAGDFDIRIVSGSTLPSEKEQETALHIQAFQMGLIDNVEALKHIEIYDAEGVIKRQNIVSQQQQMIKQLEEYIKKLEGDMQTIERESMHSREKAELEKTKSKLNEIYHEAKADRRIERKNLETAVNKVENEMETVVKQEKGKKGSE